MPKIFIAGGGNIGSLLAILLAQSGDYHVWLADHATNGAHPLVGVDANLTVVNLDVTQRDPILALIKEHAITAVVSCLPYYLNVDLAILAKQSGCHYFDLTEDIHVSQAIKDLATGSDRAFVPHCGVAPGFVNIVVADKIRHFDQVNSVLLAAGSLPQQTHHALKYALLWSTEGLINEYCNACLVLHAGQKTWLDPLTDLETIEIEGALYEAFHTSGGIGTLAETYQGTISEMAYKTIRYPGHCDKMKFLLTDLKLQDDRSTLKKILENALVKTAQDVVIVYVAVTGVLGGKIIEDTYIRKIYPMKVGHRVWTAIQIATASSACAVIDEVLKNPTQYQGFITQESFALSTIIHNQFGHIFQ